MEEEKRKDKKRKEKRERKNARERRVRGKREKTKKHGRGGKTIRDESSSINQRTLEGLCRFLSEERGVVALDDDDDGAAK